MKELSIEEKAKAYDEAIDKIKYVMEHGVSPTLNKEDLQDIFPELKESEDERIRKELIAHFKTNSVSESWSGLNVKKVIAWLEKQGEQKHTAEEVLIKAGLKPYKDGDQWCILLGDNIQEGICGFGDTIDDALYAFLNDLIKSQKEQKPVDKVEPKFHEGEWVVTDKNNVVQIKAIKDSKYVLENTMRFSVDYVDKCWRKWTIQDAKDGDVIVSEDGWICVFKGNLRGELFDSYCFMDSDGWFCPSGSTAHTLDHRYVGQFYPATKEQRDLLFQKMKEAGYEWDAKKKELKKIEQKPAWSEEDNNMLYKAIHRIEQLDYYWNVTTDMKMIDWLKSLKDRVQPQPKREWSEDDSVMIDNILGTYKTLEDMLDLTTSQDKDILESMNFERDWIKSLKYRIQPKQEWSEEDENIIVKIKTKIAQCNGFNKKNREEVFGLIDSLRAQNRCGWNDMSVKPIYPCDILYQQPNGNMFIYRYIEGGRANDAQTPTFCNLDENGKWIYLKDIKPQNTWKPSDEQIKAIRLARSFVTDDFDEHPTLSEILIELEAQLKKLREE